MIPVDVGLAAIQSGPAAIGQRSQCIVRKELRQMKTNYCSLLTAVCLFTLAATSASAQQFDTPYVVAMERNAEAWSAEDTAIDAKLAALREKYNKPPNIIYVLSDDIGCEVTA